MATPSIALTRSTPYFRARDANADGGDTVGLPTNTVDTYSETPPDNLIAMNGYRGARIIPFHPTDTAATIITIGACYKVQPYRAATTSHQFSFTDFQDTAFFTRFMCVGTATSLTANLSGTANSPMIVADDTSIITLFTAGLWATSMATAWGVQPPSFEVGVTGRPAEFIIPDMFNADYLVIFFGNPTTGGVNALVRLDT